MTDATITTVPAPASGTQTRRGKWISIALLLAILLFAAAMRLPALKSQSLWYDEVATAYIVRQPWSQVLGTIHQLENTPPLYYVVLKLWTGLAGVSEWSLRLPSALCGVLSVWLIYRLGSRLAGESSGLIAAALLASSQYHIGYSLEARAYLPMLALALWSCDEFVQMLDDPVHTWRRDVRYWVATVLLLYSHLFAVFAVAAQIVQFVSRKIFGPRTALSAARFMQLQLAVWIFFGMLIPMILGWYRSNLGDFWITQLSAIAIVRSYWMYIADLNRPLMLIFAALVVIGAARKDLRPWLGLLLSLLILPVVAPVIASILTYPLYTPRYGMIAMIGLFVLAGAGVARLPKLIQPLAVIALIVPMLKAPQAQPKEPWRDLAAYLDHWMQRGDFFLVNKRSEFAVAKFYLHRDGITYKSFRGAPVTLGLPLDDPTAHVWVVLSDPYPPQSGILTIERGHWRVVSQKAFGQLTLLELADGATEAQYAYPDDIRFNAKPPTSDRKRIEPIPPTPPFKDDRDLLP